MRGSGNNTEDEANARRIAECVNALEGFADPTAAPELLETLEKIERQLASSYDKSNKPTQGKRALLTARSAIAKARGQEQQ